MTKRITYLQRLSELPAEQFSEHWGTTHAQIAVELPGVVGYWQNHVLSSTPTSADGREDGAGDDGDGFTVDGIVELWFTSADIAQSGTTSATSDRLIEDEPRFLSGLAGAPVTDPHPAPLPAFAVWLLGWTADGSEPAPDTLKQLEEALRELPGAGATTVHTRLPGGVELRREGLQRMSALPACALSAGFTSSDAAQQAASALHPVLETWRSKFARMSTLTAAVVQIVERLET